MAKQSWPDERLDAELTRLYADTQAPESFRASWRAAVCREETQRMQEMQKTKAPARVWTRVVLPAAACLMLVVGSIVTGNMDLAQKSAAPAQTEQANTAGWSGLDYGADTASLKSGAARSVAYAGGADNGTGAAITAQDERKIVRTADMTLATGDFDTDRARIETLVIDAGGYIEYQNVGEGDKAKRSASYTLRVPTAALDQFLADLGGVGRVVSRSESADDRSTQYYDAQARLDTQRQKLVRLQELLTKAEQVSDIIEIENAIADAQYQIDSYQSTVSRLQKQVDESTVNVTLNETGAAEASQAADTPLGERIGQGFAASLSAIGRFFQNMLVFLVMAAPVLVPVAIAVAVIVLIVKRRGRKEEKKQ